MNKPLGCRDCDEWPCVDGCEDYEVKESNALKVLEQRIEIKMQELENLQRIYQDETGKPHIMPIYLKAPKYLKDLI